MQACNIREETVLQNFLGGFEILQHPLPLSIKWELQMICWIFFKVFGAAISKYCREIIYDVV